MRFLALLLFLTVLLSGAEFKSEKECVIGMKVADRENKTGKIVEVERGLCRVQLDSGGKPVAYMFWMLHAAGDIAETSDKLVVGRYDCWIGGSQGAGEVKIISGTSYEHGGKPGKYHMEANNKIVFENGPLSAYHAKLLAGPKIGMNLNGGTFYNMVCDLMKK